MSIRTEKEELALNQRRNAGLEGSVAKNPGFSCQGKVGNFISLYLMCDLFATKIQHYYQTDKQYKKTTLNTNSLKKALSHFGIHFDDNKLLILFTGGGGKRGKKSARQLRNGYLHQLSEADKLEIINKNELLTKEMKRFLTLRIKIYK